MRFTLLASILLQLAASLALADGAACNATDLGSGRKIEVRKSERRSKRIDYTHC
jgi:hypothetical protein